MRTVRRVLVVASAAGVAAVGGCDILFGPNLHLGAYVLSSMGADETPGPPFFLHDSTDADGHRDAWYIAADTFRFQAGGRMSRTQAVARILWTGAALDTLESGRGLSGSYDIRNGAVAIAYDDFGGLPLFTDDTLRLEEDGRLRDDLSFVSGCPPDPCVWVTIVLRYRYR